MWARNFRPWHYSRYKSCSIYVGVSSLNSLSAVNSMKRNFCIILWNKDENSSTHGHSKQSKSLCRPTVSSTTAQLRQRSPTGGRELSILESANRPTIVLKRAKFIMDWDSKWACNMSDNIFLKYVLSYVFRWFGTWCCYQSLLNELNRLRCTVRAIFRVCGRFGMSL